MKNILLYLWQLPQNLLGLLVILFSKAVKDSKGIWRTKHTFGVSLGKYIILYTYSFDISVKHEQGHQRQSLYLGWLYLIIIGLPSALGNIFDRVFHKHWLYVKREKWYYSLPWERQADKLGGVKRKCFLEY